MKLLCLARRVYVQNLRICMRADKHALLLLCVCVCVCVCVAGGTCTARLPSGCVQGRVTTKWTRCTCGPQVSCLAG
jgi:hypothetical protein